MVQKKILVSSKEFKLFWKENGPFRYALTCNEYPPVLMEPEEWIFSNDILELLKGLMQFNARKMKFIKAPFNPKNKNILRPEELSSWKINHFPEEWNACNSDIFIPEGHLTQTTVDRINSIDNPDGENDAVQVEKVFFQCLEQEIGNLGYLLLAPQGASKNAAIKTYLEEWEKDEQDAGMA